MKSRLTNAQHDLLKRRDAGYLEKPLSLTLYTPSGVAHVRHMVRLLRSPKSASPCSDAMEHLQAVFDRSLSHYVPERARQAIACSKGCAHCCVQVVGISALEAFQLVRVVRQREAAAAIQDASRGVAQFPGDKKLFNTRCPLLAANACSVYEPRPLSCRSFASLNVNACISKFVLKTDSTISYPTEHVPVTNACRLVLYTALGLIGRQDFAANYEMNSVLAHLLQMDETAEARWLKGEDIMAGVLRLDDIEDVFAWEIRQTINAIRPTL